MHVGQEVRPQVAPVPFRFLLQLLPLDMCGAIELRLAPVVASVEDAHVPLIYSRAARAVSEGCLRNSQLSSLSYGLCVTLFFCPDNFFSSRF